MKSELAVLFAAAALLLVVGALLGRWVSESPTPAAADNGYRAWFWSHRSLDLAIQIGLVFAGALGVAAILPREREDNDEVTPL